MNVNITKEKFINMMGNIIEYKELIDNFASVLDKTNIIRWDDSNELDNKFCELVDSLASMLDLPENDVFGNDLMWYLFETNCGTECNIVKIDGVEHTIETVEDLYDLISGKFNTGAATT